MRGLKTIFIGLLVFLGLFVAYKFTRPTHEQLCLANAELLIGGLDVHEQLADTFGELTLIQEFPGDVAASAWGKKSKGAQIKLLSLLNNKAENAKCPAGGLYKLFSGQLCCSRHGHFVAKKKTFIPPKKLSKGVAKGNPDVYWGNSYCIVDSGNYVTIQTRSFYWELHPKEEGESVQVVRNNDRVLLVVKDESVDITDHPARDEMLAKIKYSFD